MSDTMHHAAGHGERGTYMTCGVYGYDLKDDTFTAIVRLVTCQECLKRLSSDARPTVSDRTDLTAFLAELERLKEKRETIPKTMREAAETEADYASAAVSALPRLVATIRELMEENARLREALKPFAAWAESLDDPKKKKLPGTSPLCYLIREKPQGDGLPTVDDLRAARKAIKED